MKITKWVVLLLVTVFLVALPLIANAEPKNPNEARQLLKEQHLRLPPKVIQHDASLAACTAYVNQVKLINSTHASCMNPNTAPSGSPVSNFNKMTNIQLGQFCGAKSLNQCVADVLTQQDVYCDNKVKPLQTKAERMKAECGQAKKECTDAKAKKQDAEKKYVTLENQKKQLEAQLTNVLHQLAAAHTALVKANQEVQHQCTIQVVHPPAPGPIHILLPPGYQPAK